jgi:CHASE2 domain-containing sensor protein
MTVADVLTYVAIAVGLASLLINFLAWRRNQRRRWLYLVGMAVSVWFAGSYILLAAGVVTIGFMTASGVLRWGAIMGMLLTAAHALVDT